MPKRFEYISQLHDKETFAQGSGIRELARLEAAYGPGNWRKCKGRAKVERNGQIVDAEIHWYEAHGIGRKEDKIVRIIR